MFAFVLVDRMQRRVFAARDRFGVKPLYYWVSPAGLVAFASEIKQFTGLPGWRPIVNGPRAYDFLNWGLFDHTSETLFSNVRQLRGGEYVSCSIDELRKGIVVKRWYNLAPADSPSSPEEAAARELAEETGYVGRDLECVVSLRTTSALGQRHVVIARDCRPETEQRLDEYEDCEPVILDDIAYSGAASI